MSQENVESVRRFYSAWNRRDLDSALSDAWPDFEIVPLPTLPTSGARGHAEAKRFWAQFFEGFEEIRVQPADEFIGVGQMVIAPLHWWARGRDGIEVEQRMVDLWTFRAGRMARLQGFESKAEALEAVGLRE